MAIVELDRDPFRRPHHGDRALIVGLGVAIGAFMFAMWLTAPHPAAQPIVAARPSAAPTPLVQPVTTTMSPSGMLVAPSGQTFVLAAPRALELPAGLASVDLFLIPVRLTNENLYFTLRDAVWIRGRQGLASAEGPAIITWTEGDFQYWMVSPTKSTADLIRIADLLKDEVPAFQIGRKVNIR